MRSYCAAQGTISNFLGVTWWKIVWEKECVYIYVWRVCVCVCVWVTGSQCCTAEIDTTLYINYTLVKIKVKNMVSTWMLNTSCWILYPTR